MSDQANDRNNTTSKTAAFPRTPEAPATGRRESKAPNRYIPRGYERIELDDVPADAECYADPAGGAAIGYSGKRGKPDWHYRFRSRERMTQHIEQWAAGLRSAEAWRAERRATRAAAADKGHGCHVGDVFRCSWGYDQTNVDYYEIVALHGKTLATVRRIAEQIEVNGYMQGDSVPAPGKYLERYEPQRVKLTPGEPARFRAYSFAHACKMTPTAVIDGRPIYETSHWTSYA